MSDIDIKKTRACAALLEPPASHVVWKLCDEIERLQEQLRLVEGERDISVAVYMKAISKMLGVRDE